MLEQLSIRQIAGYREIGLRAIGCKDIGKSGDQVIGQSSDWL